MKRHPGLSEGTCWKGETWMLFAKILLKEQISNGSFSVSFQVQECLEAQEPKSLLNHKKKKLRRKPTWRSAQKKIHVLSWFKITKFLPNVNQILSIYQAGRVIKNTISHKELTITYRNMLAPTCVKALTSLSTNRFNVNLFLCDPEVSH